MKHKLSKDQLFEVYCEKGTLKETAEASGYSFIYLKKLSGLHDWVNKAKLKDVDDDENTYIEIIRGIDNSIQRISKIPILDRLPKGKNKGIEGFVLGPEEILTDKIETDPEGNVVVSKAEIQFMREEIEKREQAVEQEKKVKEEKKVKKIKKEPFEAAIDSVIEIVPGAANNRKAIARELRRWLGKWYTIEEAIPKAISTMQGIELEKKKEKQQPKTVDESRGGCTNRMWNKLWGRIILGG